MKRFVASLLPWLALGVAHAQSVAQKAAQGGAPAEPPVDSNPVATIVFAVLFFGFCLGFAFLVWRNQKKGRQDGSEPK